MPPELMSARVAAHYHHNTDGRIVSLNQWDGGEAPRWYFGRGRTDRVWRCRADVPGDLARDLGTLADGEPRDLEPAREPVGACGFVDLLAPVSQVWSGPAFWFPAIPALKPASKMRVVAITPANAEALMADMPDWIADVPHRQPFLGAVVEDRVVSVCASVRISDAVHEAGVETCASFRRRGLAGSVVAAWAAEVRALGAQPIYSTAWTNDASLGVAASLDLELVGVDYHVT